MSSKFDALQSIVISAGQVISGGVMSPSVIVVEVELNIVRYGNCNA